MVQLESAFILDKVEHEKRERDIPAVVRATVLERDNHQCVSCGNAGDNRLQLHHVIFRSQGGDHDEENLVTLCFDCHEDVHNGWLKLALIEHPETVFSWFCARKRPPRRWRQTFNTKFK
jgi:5-methylcytosine-specific restriction endonuclease McrA